LTEWHELRNATRHYSGPVVPSKCPYKPIDLPKTHLRFHLCNKYKLRAGHSLTWKITTSTVVLKNLIVLSNTYYSILLLQPLLKT